MEYCYEKLPLKTAKNPQGECFSSPLSLSKEVRPRERLIRSGPQSLSDRDLLSIVLVSGIHGSNVTQIADELLLMLDEEKDIPSVGKLSSLPGLGESKACTVAAMLEFGRRKWASGQRVQRPADIFSLVRHYADRKQEKFLCLSFNGAHEVLAVRIVTVGLVNRTIVHPREVFADPLLDRAIAIAVAHNHPSGNVIPSEEDKNITFRLKLAADILGLSFLDHLIFTENLFFSFRQEGLINDAGKLIQDFDGKDQPNIVW